MPCIVESPVASTPGGFAAPPRTPTATDVRMRWRATMSSTCQRPRVVAANRCVATFALGPNGRLVQTRRRRGDVTHSFVAIPPIPHWSITRTRTRCGRARRAAATSSNRCAHDVVRTL
jgi:hypothetical protein